MPPFIECDRCGKTEKFCGRFWSSGQWGLLCEDCNLEWGMFKTFAMPLFQSFIGNIRWTWSYINKGKADEKHRRVS
jgi:hypothetical protein